MLRIVLLSLVFALSLISRSGYAAKQTGLFGGGDCARRMNALANDALDLDINYSWIGNVNTPGAYGWLRMSLPSFYQLLVRASIPKPVAERIVELIDGIRLGETEVRAFNREHPAVLASYAGQHFIQANRQGRDLYAAIATPEIVPNFSDQPRVVNLFDCANFSFADEKTCNLIPFQEARSSELIRMIEGIFMTPPPTNDDEQLKIWVADLLAAIHKWDDLQYLGTMVQWASQMGNTSAHRWRDEHVGSDPNGNLILAHPYFPLFIELRGESAGSWARLIFSRLGPKDNWQHAFREAVKDPRWEDLQAAAQVRAMSQVAKVTPEELLAPYRQMMAGKGLFRGHVGQIVKHFRLR